MDYCINIEHLRAQLIHDINNSGLTIGCATLVVKDVYNTLYLSFLEEKEKEMCRPPIQEKELTQAMNLQQEVTENENQNND